MPNVSLVPVVGTIRSVENMEGNCCNKMITIWSPEEEVKFVLSPDTVVIDSIPLRAGMYVAAFYDTNAPMPLIFPPQYQAVIMTRLERGENVILTRCDDNLTSFQNTLQLTPGRATRVTTVNGQRYSCDLSNRDLLVYYSNTTRSIPPQTTPRRIVVLC